MYSRISVVYHSCTVEQFGLYHRCSKVVCTIDRIVLIQLYDNFKLRTNRGALKWYHRWYDKILSQVKKNKMMLEQWWSITNVVDYWCLSKWWSITTVVDCWWYDKILSRVKKR